MSARLPRVRLRLEGDDARHAAPRRTALGCRGRPEPAGGIGTAPRRDEGLAVASLSHAQASIAEPLARPRARPTVRRRKRSRARARGGILWIAVSGILLAGVVFVNVAVLQLNLSLDSANSSRSKLLAENAALESQYSALIASNSIQQQAVRKFGLVYEDPSAYGYVNLAK